MIRNPESTSILAAGVVLAGGESRRMGGQQKALAGLAGKPLLQHVVERFGPQVGRLYLSVGEASAELAEFGLPRVYDPVRNAGPLAGLLAAMRASAAEFSWLSLAPCDAPFLPRDLVARLLSRALEAGAPGAVVRYREGLQPTFSLWSHDLLPPLEQLAETGANRGLKYFSRVSELAVLDWPEEEPSPFFNVNDPAALARADRLLAGTIEVEAPCSA